MIYLDNAATTLHKPEAVIDGLYLATQILQEKRKGMKK